MQDGSWLGNILSSHWGSCDSGSDGGISETPHAEQGTTPDAFRDRPGFVLPLHREMAALHLELQTPQKTQIFYQWGNKHCLSNPHSCLKEKAAVQEEKASWQEELAHRWNLMSCTIINNILLQLQGFQTHHKDGWTGKSLLWLIPDSLYDQKFGIWSCWIKTFCIFLNAKS